MLAFPCLLNRKWLFEEFITENLGRSSNTAKLEHKDTTINYHQEASECLVGPWSLLFATQDDRCGRRVDAAGKLIQQSKALSGAGTTKQQGFNT